MIRGRWPLMLRTRLGGGAADESGVAVGELDRQGGVGPDVASASPWSFPREASRQASLINSPTFACLTRQVAVQRSRPARYPGAARSAHRPTAAASVLVLLVAGFEKYREEGRSSRRKGRFLM